MDDILNIPPLSKESCYEILECIDRALANLEFIDQALSNLDGSEAFFVEPDLTVNDLFTIFAEARYRLLTQLDAYDEPEANRDFSHESLKYTYQIEAMRDGIGRRT